MKENASIRSIKMYGVNLSASCHTISTADIHPELEKQLLFTTIIFPECFIRHR